MVAIRSLPALGVLAKKQVGTVDGSEIRPTSWYGKYPSIYRVLYIPGGWPWDFFHRHYYLPEINMAPENGWSENDRFLLGLGLFSGAMLTDLPKVIPSLDGLLNEFRYVGLELQTTSSK